MRKLAAVVSSIVLLLGITFAGASCCHTAGAAGGAVHERRAPQRNFTGRGITVGGAIKTRVNVYK